MKTHLLAFCLLFPTITATGQTRKFMDSSALWVERVVEWDQGNGQGLLSDRNVLYAIESDTLINQERYGKITVVGEYGEFLDNGQPRKLIPYRIRCQQNCYVGAIRLDTVLN